MRGSASQYCLAGAVLLCAITCARADYISEIYAGGSDASIPDSVEITLNHDASTNQAASLSHVAASRQLGLLILSSNASQPFRTVLNNLTITATAQAQAILFSVCSWSPTWATAPPHMRIDPSLDLDQRGALPWQTGRTLLLLAQPADIAVKRSFDPRTFNLPAVLDAVTFGSPNHAQPWADERIIDPSRGYAIDWATLPNNINRPLQGTPNPITGQLIGINPAYYLSPGYINNTWTGAPSPATLSLALLFSLLLILPHRLPRARSAPGSS